MFFLQHVSTFSSHQVSVLSLLFNSLIRLMSLFLISTKASPPHSLIFWLFSCPLFHPRNCFFISPGVQLLKSLQPHSCSITPLYLEMRYLSFRWSILWQMKLTCFVPFFRLHASVCEFSIYRSMHFEYKSNPCLLYEVGAAMNMWLGQREVEIWKIFHATEIGRTANCQLH